MSTSRGPYSQRALEETEDLLAEIEQDLVREGLAGRPLRFQLEGASTLLSREQAAEWMRESVDSGFPRVGYRLAERSTNQVIVNLAAYEDPDSQYHP